MVANQESNLDICGICLENINNPVELNCKHKFCNRCIQDYDNFIHKNKYIDPCLFGAPRCPCINSNSCLNRPCNSIDANIMRKWELEAPIQYRDWNLEESLNINKNSYVNIMKCPICRSEINIRL